MQSPSANLLQRRKTLFCATYELPFVLKYLSDSRNDCFMSFHTRKMSETLKEIVRNAKRNCLPLPQNLIVCRWCTMRVGAVLATATNILLLTFFVFQSFQSPFGRRHLAQISQMMDLQKQNLMAAEEHFKLGNPSAESFFKPWIKKDLSTWAQEGISLVSPAQACLGNFP